MTQRCIVLTGATRGLGRALAEAFAAAGHKVIGCGTKPDLVQELNSVLGAPHSCSVVDVSSDHDVQQWAQDVLAEHGPPDILINNAALMNRPAPLWEIPPEEFSRLIDVNVKGIAYVCRAFVPAMRDGGRGVIINLSSGWGRHTSPSVAPYCASKFAVEGLTKALAMELPREMAAVPLSPGVIDTDMLRECWGEEASQYQTPHDWAAKAVPSILRIGPKDSGRSLAIE
jgi:NAD(P)-dependent dehydrogenase (short-subunit alcohol dehydrogenase family)